MSDENRPKIPAATKRKVLVQAGHRCSVCGDPAPLEIAHITPWRQSKEHRAEDLICLCASCHQRADNEKWGEQTLRVYKKKPFVRRKTDRDFISEPKRKIKVDIQMEIDDLDEKQKRLLHHAIAGFLEISPKAIKMTSVREWNSIRVEFELPASSSEKLVEAIRSGSKELRELAPFDFIDAEEVVPRIARQEVVVGPFGGTVRDKIPRSYSHNAQDVAWKRIRRHRRTAVVVLIGPLLFAVLHRVYLSLDKIVVRGMVAISNDSEEETVPQIFDPEAEGFSTIQIEGRPLWFGVSPTSSERFDQLTPTVGPSVTDDACVSYWAASRWLNDYQLYAESRYPKQFGEGGVYSGYEIRLPKRREIEAARTLQEIRSTEAEWLWMKAASPSPRFDDRVPVSDRELPVSALHPATAFRAVLAPPASGADR